jgi:hypothetical protein
MGRRWLVIRFVISAFSSRSLRRLANNVVSELYMEARRDLRVQRQQDAHPGATKEVAEERLHCTGFGLAADNVGARALVSRAT